MYLFWWFAGAMFIWGFFSPDKKIDWYKKLLLGLVWPMTLGVIFASILDEIKG